MSFLKRSNHSTRDIDSDEDDTIDPELRLRTVRTAASAIAESIRSEQKAEKRKFRRRRGLFGKSSEKHPEPSTSGEAAPSTEVPGQRRNVYVNHPLAHSEMDSNGEPIARYERNKVRTTSESLIHIILSADLTIILRIYGHHLYTQESIRAISPVSGILGGRSRILTLRM
jgi:phospholipid-translocating ATPase